MSTMLNLPFLTSPAAFDAKQLEADRGHWTYALDDRARRDLLDALNKVYDPDRPMLDYRKEEFDPGSALPMITAAFNQTKHGRGVALLQGLPREGVDEQRFRLLTWLIGLHTGVGRPQGKASHYLSEVRDAGTDYRTTTGRGYSSNAELDFHTDSTDIVVLSCYNKAPEGGMSLTSSSIRAFALMQERHPALAEYLLQPIHFSRQGEQAPDEAPSYPHPIFDEAGGKLFSKWNRNRVTSAQKLEGVPRISAEHWQALETFDALVHSDELAHSMWLQPGDLQVINSHTTLHSRTEFTDNPVNKRLLYRLWITPPDSDPLPESWRVLYKATAPGTVRGGIIGQQHDAACKAYEARQARALGMGLTD